MRVKRFVASDMRQAMRMIREELGDEAIILGQKRTEQGIEVTTGIDYDEEMLQQMPKKPLTSALALQQLGEALPTGDSASANKLQRHLDEARRKILQGAKFSKQNLENTFQRQARQYQTGHLEEKIRTGEAFISVDSEPETLAKPKDYQEGYAQGAALAVRSEQAKLDERMLSTMRQEIQSLRDLLKEQLREQQGLRHPVEAMLRQRLLQMGVNENYCARLLQLSAVDESWEMPEAWSHLVHMLERDVQVMDEEITERGGVLALMGPTGVGKTTTLGKLAARYVLRHGPDALALVTTDCYRIAAYEQLRTFGRILGVPVRVVDETNTLDTVLKGLRNRSLVLVDTAGLNNKDPNLHSQFGMLDTKSVRVRRFLVLPCTAQAGVLQATYEAYKVVGLNGCILTKTDEATSLGEVLSLVSERRLPVAYWTYGQRIPEDIQVANAPELVEKALAFAGLLPEALDDDLGEWH